MSENDRLVSVRRVPDETTATLLCDFLRENGVPATPVAVQIPWLPGVETFHHGYWGQVEVMERDADRARALIEDFYAAEPQPEPGTAPEPEDEGPGGAGPSGGGDGGPDATPAA